MSEKIFYPFMAVALFIKLYRGKLRYRGFWPPRIVPAFAIVFLSLPSLFAQNLAAKAQEEKKLVLYHSTGIEDTQQLLDLFGKRYAFLQIENHRLSSPKLLQRITSEVRAGRNLADAYILSGAQTWLLKDIRPITARSLKIGEEL